VGLIVECPSLEAFQKALEGEAATDAMKFDRVRPETIQMFVEG
jgi:nicotinate-nucleotide pyrophosphorylase